VEQRQSSLELVAEMTKTDFLVVGGGVVGLSIARELKRRFSDATVALVEKEPECGLHASGRNSGVIHAGFYYSADSLKAKFTRDGNRMLLQYCEEKTIPVNKCGKLVVAKDETELPQLDELLRRGKANGVVLQSITAQEALKIEPRVKTFQRAIFSPATSTADPIQVLQAMKRDALKEGISIHQNAAYVGTENGNVKTLAGDFEAGFVVNAAGLYADRVARDFGFSDDYRILPFKGIYLYSDEPAGAIRTNIYPVPDLRNPFLGVHFTLLVDGRAKIGPTAIPAFWREQYKGLTNFKFDEFAEIIFRDLGLLFFSGFDFKRLAVEETLKYYRPRLVNLASTLLENVKLENFRHWGKPGIRAQLLNIKTKKLEMDFVIQNDAKSLHVLNAVSPAWTCALPFAKYVCDKIEASREGDRNLNHRQPDPAPPIQDTAHSPLSSHAR
jgi:L-2-hydroxyglutarate oxidase LhgO